MQDEVPAVSVDTATPLQLTAFAADSQDLTSSISQLGPCSLPAAANFVISTPVKRYLRIPATGSTTFTGGNKSCLPLSRLAFVA